MRTVIGIFDLRLALAEDLLATRVTPTGGKMVVSLRRESGRIKFSWHLMGGRSQGEVKLHERVPPWRDIPSRMNRHIPMDKMNLNGSWSQETPNHPVMLPFIWPRLTTPRH